MSKLKIIILLVVAAILLMGAESCCPKEIDQHLAALQNTTATDIKNSFIILNTNSNENTNTAFQKACLISIKTEQLHQGEELPHRYNLSVVAVDCETNNNVSREYKYNWLIDCGYFWDDAKLGQVVQDKPMVIEWRYDTDQECVNAQVTITLSDGSNSLTRKVF